MSDGLARVAELLHQRNLIDEEIAGIIQRPMASGHLGEWIAARVFDIELETSASNAAADGRFRTGLLQGRTVNIKWYLKREGLLDMTTADSLDYYLVMTGPASAAASSWLSMVERWFGELTTELLQRGVHKSVQALEADIRAWIETWNEGSAPLCMDQDGRRDPRQHRSLLYTNFRRGTLGCFADPAGHPVATAVRRARCADPLNLPSFVRGSG